MYSVHESDTGYLYRTFLYTGKEFTDELQGDFHFVATEIVQELMAGLLHHGRTLFVDNWYLSFELAKLMLTQNTDLIGTLQCDHKNLPSQRKKKKAKDNKLNKGDQIVFYVAGTNIMVTRWKDKKDVTLMSTCVNDGTVNVMRSGKE